MARIFIDGFESGDLGQWLVMGGSPTINSGALAGKSGTYYLSLPVSGTYVKTSLPSTYSTVYGAFKLWMSGPGLEAPFFYLHSDANEVFRLSYGYTNGNTIKFYIGGVYVNTSAQTLVLNALQLVEFYFYIADSSGRVVVKVNGITVIDYTGDTKPSTFSTVNTMFLFAGSGQFVFDDVILDDANWIGPTSIQGLAVTGAGSTTQFDPSTGSNYACVDEIPPSDADYISTNVANEIDTYACGDLTGTINSVKAVQVQARCVQEGSPAVPKIQLVTRPTSTDRVSASKSIQTFAPGVVSNIWELNPDDSAAWESADVNGMEIGVKAVAS